MPFTKLNVLFIILLCVFDILEKIILVHPVCVVVCLLRFVSNLCSAYSGEAAML